MLLARDHEKRRYCCYNIIIITTGYGSGSRVIGHFHPASGAGAREITRTDPSTEVRHRYNSQKTGRTWAMLFWGKCVTRDLKL